MGEVIQLDEHRYGQGVEKAYSGLDASDEIVAKVLRISEVSRIARIEVNLREFIEAKWDIRVAAAVKKASSMAAQLKPAGQIAAAIDRIMKQWAADVTTHFIREQTRIYKLAREAGFKKATRQTTAPLTYDSPNATQMETGVPVAPNPQVEAERSAGKKIPVIKAKPFVPKPKVEVVPSFDAADKAAITAMNKQQTFWIGRHYGKNVAGGIRDVTRGAMLEAGKDRVAAGTLMAERVKNRLGNIIKTPGGFIGSTKQYFEGLVANAATVARVQGQMRSFADIGITRYTISNPGGKRTCPVCLHVNGKVFETQQGLDQMHKDLAADTPDKVRAAHPWNTPKQVRNISPTPGRMTGTAGTKDSAALAGAGMSLPPFHFRCRCTVDISNSIGSYNQQLPFSPVTPTAAAVPLVAPPLAKVTAGDLIARQLMSSQLVSSKAIGEGVNQAQKAVFLSKDGKTTTAVMKFASLEERGLRRHVKTGTFYRREAAVYQLDRAMGGKTVVPPTVVRDLGTGQGPASLQHFIKGAKDTYRVDGPTIRPRMRRVALLDIVSGNDDRHMSNIMFKPFKVGLDPIAIDNGLTFPSGPTRRFLLADRAVAADLMKLDAETHKLVKKLKLGELAGILRDAQVPDKAIRATLVRARALQLDPAIISSRQPSRAMFDQARSGPEARTLKFVHDSFKPETLLPTKEIGKIDAIISEL